LGRYELNMDSTVSTGAILQRLKLAQPVLDAIRRHGRQAYPNECCGALIGQEDHVIETLFLPNTTAEGPRQRFLISPEDYRFAEERAFAAEHELLGFYHSHPDHPARPSQHDLAHAWPFFVYVILAVREGDPVDLTAWRLLDDRSAFGVVEVTYGASGRHRT